MLRASTWLQALDRFRPDIARQTQLAFDARSTDAAFVRPSRLAALCGLNTYQHDSLQVTAPRLVRACEWAATLTN